MRTAMRQIPILLTKQSSELSFDSYQTQHLGACPEAARLMKKLVIEFDNGSIGYDVDVTQRTQNYIANKPDRIRHQQYKHYTDL